MFERFKHRSLRLERLDTGDYTPAEYSLWQREMKLIHRFLGEERAIERSLLTDIRKAGIGSVSILDVGAGSGGLLRKVRDSNGFDGPDSLLVGCEIDHVAARSIHGGGVRGVQCDGLALPFGDGAFDYAFCTLFLHHLTDDDAVRLLTEMSRVAGKRMYVIDLNRHPAAYYGYKALGFFMLQRLTREDGALSILRSRTPEELREIASTAGLANIKVEHSRANRLILSGE